MRVFLAGGAGVIGQPLIRQLIAGGHEVVATTRSSLKVAVIRGLGATPVVLDALDPAAVLAAVRAAKPEAIIHQLTALPPRYEPARAEFYTMTSRLRSEGTRHLVSAAREVGATRFVYQSIAFLARPQGPKVLTEAAPAWDDAPEPYGDAVRKTLEGERMAMQTAGLQGVVLRYGQLYGPGTYFGPQGDFAVRARKRMLPIVGDGTGVFSFLHVEDAAGAAAAALTGEPGVYTVTDDDPAAAREWIPAFCAAVGAPRPMQVPVWLARLIAGSFVTSAMVESRGFSNARGKAGRGWTPVHPSWREGLGRG